MDEERIRKIIEWAKIYYSLHKKDQPKPIIWDLILAVKWLCHKWAVLERVQNENVKLKDEMKALEDELEECEERLHCFEEWY